MSRATRDDQIHHANISNGQGPDDGTAAEALRYISEIDDLPIDEDDEVMGQLISKLTSTANLTAEQVRSNEWVREYLLILYLARRPRKDGVHGGWRAWSHDDPDADVEPMEPAERAKLETFVETSKLGLTRSEDMESIKEVMRNRTESFVHDDAEDESSGGILGRLK